MNTLKPVPFPPIYEDSQILVINKPAGVPVQPDKTGDPSVMDLWPLTLFPVNRIDRPVSGLVLLAKSKDAAGRLQELFQRSEIEKTYLAAVSAAPPQAEDTLVHFLKKNGKTNATQAFEAEQPGAQRAELHYKLLGSSDKYHLLEIKLLTGRHHQIRAQLQAIGCPVKGDVKYGARRSNPDRSIHLHAWRLGFEHPFSGEWLEMEAPLPQEDSVWKFFEGLISAV